MTFPILPSNAASTGYNLTRSLRFRASASAYLNRTPASAGNQNTWTWSGWVKRGALGSGQRIFGTSLTGTSDNNLGDFFFSSADKIGFFQFNAGTTYTDILSTQVFRDPSAWYHIVLVYDDTQATAANRVKIYVNGVQITAFDTAAYPTQNFIGFFNGALPHTIGRYTGAASGFYYDGYLTEINFIDGQALTPSSFGSTNALTGVWQPARYTGTYGTNGFYLPFTENSALTTSSNVGLGKDFSGNGNYWTTNNISITAGVTYDSMTDVPTLTDTSTANFCVFNPLDKGSAITVSNGNLTITGTGSNNSMGKGTFWVNSGKWYWESVATAGSLGAVTGIAGLNFSQIPWSGDMYGYDANGNKIVNGTSSAYGASYAANDVIGVALDLSAGTITFYKNNVSQGTITGVSTSLLWTPFSHANNLVVVHWNMGQQPFTYTPPTGFVSLNAFNLPTSTIVKGNTVMDATLYTGTGASLSVTNTASFKPDLVWVKSRSAATDHALYDSVRGVQNQLESNTTTAETAEATGLTAFGSAGFTVGALAQMNTNTATYVGWQWQAGQGSSSSNTSGSITSTVSVNASAGFSVVTWAYNSSGGTIGHGLGVAPQLIIQKDRTNGTYSWDVYHASLGATQRLSLNSTNATQSQIVWNNTSPTSSVFSSGASWYTNTDSMVSYCWTPIAGYSAFGSYSGNASTDGPFIYTGFRPKFVMIKRYDVGSPWVMLDSSRNTYNVVNNYLLANASDAEASGSSPNDIDDFLSNGFKVRCSNAGQNASGGGYLYAAWAENPFKNALAR